MINPVILMCVPVLLLIVIVLIPLLSRVNTDNDEPIGKFTQNGYIGHSDPAMHSSKGYNTSGK